MEIKFIMVTREIVDISNSEDYNNYTGNGINNSNNKGNNIKPYSSNNYNSNLK